MFRGKFSVIKKDCVKGEGECHKGGCVKGKVSVIRGTLQGGCVIMIVSKERRVSCGVGIVSRESGVSDFCV